MLLRPTGSVEVARARLVALPTGGRTPLAAGITTALEPGHRPGPGRHPPARPGPGHRRAGHLRGRPALTPSAPPASAADAVRRAGVDAVVIDVESAGAGPQAGGQGTRPRPGPRPGGAHGRPARAAAGRDARGPAAGGAPAGDARVILGQVVVLAVRSPGLRSLRPPLPAPAGAGGEVGSAPMRLLMVAPPGAGKGTQATRLAEPLRDRPSVERRPPSQGGGRRDRHRARPPSLISSGATSYPTTSS